MATDISHTLFTSAMAPQPVFHPAVEPRRTSSIPTQTRDEPSLASPTLTNKEVQYAVSQMNDLAKAMNHRLSFTMDYETHDIIVKVVDAETDKVIRELPPAELQKLHRSIKEAVGLLIDKMI